MVSVFVRTGICAEYKLSLMIYGLVCSMGSEYVIRSHYHHSKLRWSHQRVWEIIQSFEEMIPLKTNIKKLTTGAYNSSNFFLGPVFSSLQQRSP